MPYLIIIEFVNLRYYIIYKPLVKWHHGSLQNCNHQFDSDKVCLKDV